MYTDNLCVYPLIKHVVCTRRLVTRRSLACEIQVVCILYTIIMDSLKVKGDGQESIITAENG